MPVTRPRIDFQTRGTRELVSLGNTNLTTSFVGHNDRILYRDSAPSATRVITLPDFDDLETDMWLTVVYNYTTTGSNYFRIDVGDVVNDSFSKLGFTDNGSSTQLFTTSPSQTHELYVYGKKSTRVWYVIRTEITTGNIIQGGNSFGAAMVIGTNDSNTLSFETNGTTRATFSTTGDLSITNTTAVTLFQTTALQLTHNTSGTPSNNFGLQIAFKGKSSSTNDRDLGFIGPRWINATDASRRSEFSIGVIGAGQALGAVARFYANDSVGMQIAKAITSFSSSGTDTTAAEYRGVQINPGTDGFTIGNNANTVTIGGSTGRVFIQSTSSSNPGIVISSEQNAINAKIDIGNSYVQNQTSGSKIGVHFTESWQPGSGTSTYSQIELGGTLNSAGSGITRSLFVNPTYTAAPDHRAVEISINNANAKGIYQTGANTTNNFVGSITIGSTASPTSAHALKIDSTTKSIKLPIIPTGSIATAFPDRGSFGYWDEINYITYHDGTTYRYVPKNIVDLLDVDAPSGLSAETYKVLFVNGSDEVDFSDALSINSSDTITFTSNLDTDLIIQSTGDLTGNSGTSPTPRITFKSTNNNAAIQNGDLIYRFGFDGRKATTQTGFLPTIVAFAANTWTDTDIKHRVTFYSANSNPNHLGTGTVNEVFGFTNEGNIRTYFNGGLFLDRADDQAQGVLLKAASNTSTYTITLPSTAPSSNTYLKYNGSAYVWDTASASSDTLDLTTVPTVDTANGVRASFTAGETLAFGEVVYVRDSTGAKVFKYDANDTTGTPDYKNYPAIGVATAAITSGNAGNILLHGVIRKNTGWAWTIGQPVYASITAGGLSQTAPTASGDVVQIIGVAIASDAIYVNPQLIQLQLT